MLMMETTWVRMRYFGRKQTRIMAPPTIFSNTLISNTINNTLARPNLYIYIHIYRCVCAISGGKVQGLWRRRRNVLEGCARRFCLYYSIYY